MAVANIRLITALRVTAARIDAGRYYRWTHMGACNCGHLAQTLTALSPAEIRRRALEKAGEWADQAVEYCPDSGLVIDHILGTMLDVGLSSDDIGHLEKLSDPAVLRALPDERRPLDHRRRGDVVLYMRTWANFLENSLQDRPADSSDGQVAVTLADPIRLRATDRPSAARPADDRHEPLQKTA